MPWHSSHAGNSREEMLHSEDNRVFTGSLLTVPLQLPLEQGSVPSHLCDQKEYLVEADSVIFQKETGKEKTKQLYNKNPGQVTG